MSISKFSEMIKESNNIVFFGGAGVSTESGIKDYRSKDGIYNTVKEFGISPEEILSKSFISSYPDVFYNFYKKYFIIDAEPNGAHIALSQLEKMGKLRAVITQNVDRLHQKAGSQNVLELHGTTTEYVCCICGKEQDSHIAEEEIIIGNLPRCKSCNCLVRPKVVLYGESLPSGIIEKSIAYVENADMLIVGGTSLVVQPAASIVSYFRGKFLVIINKTETDYDGNADLIIRDSIGEVFEKVMRKM